MKNYKFILITNVLIWTSCISMQLSPDMKKSLKEFQYQFKQNPRFHCGLFGLLALEGAVSWYINPWISVSINAGFGALAFLLLCGQAPHADARKRYHDHQIYTCIGLGYIEAINNLASQNHYNERDPEILKEQNSTYLYETLCQYHYEFFKTENCPLNYLRTAQILLEHHADSKEVINRLRLNYPPTHKGLQWLESHQADRKAKLH